MMSRSDEQIVPFHISRHLGECQPRDLKSVYGKGHSRPPLFLPSYTAECLQYVRI